MPTMRAIFLSFLGLFTSLILTAAASAADPVKIGYIYVGPTADYGYNYSMELGRLHVNENLKDVESLYVEQIPETAEVERVMERLISNGHKIIFATSYGYLDHAIKIGKKYPDVAFLHAGGLKTSSNLGTYWADSDDGMYLAGMVAGSVSKSGKLGFVGAFQIPQLLRSINAFTLGAQSVNPAATTTVVWTGGWWEPAKEAEAVNAFADQGIDVIAEQVDSPITIAKAAEKRGVYVIGKDVDIQDRAPAAWLTGVSWNWGPMMANLVTQIRAGTWSPSHVRGNLADGSAVLDPFGAAVPQNVRDNVLAEKAKIISGEKVVWSGTITKQSGEVIGKPGQRIKMETVESIDFLIKGVIGAAK